jgi:hypothetical protein
MNCLICHLVGEGIRGLLLEWYALYTTIDRTVVFNCAAAAITSRKNSHNNEAHRNNSRVSEMAS